MGLFWNRNSPAPAAPASSAAWSAALPVLVAAFGKHPGWDDHIDDIGLKTGALVEAKQVFYLNGIGRQIDLGAWDALEESQRLPEFKHFFFWRRTTHWMMGRIWSSSDGKGRTRYPMIVCCQYDGPDAIEAVRRVFTPLAELERECKSARTADEVRAILGRASESLRAALENPAASRTAEEEDRLVKEMMGAAGEEALFRVIYQVQTQMSAYARQGAARQASKEEPRPQQVRVPAAPGLLLDSVLFWMRFFMNYSGRDVPILLAAPAGEPWLDVTLGQPGEQEFFCLRASPKSLPPASEIPYALEEPFRAEARALLEAFRKMGPADFAALESAPSNGDTGTQRFFKTKLFGRS
jgi:hypothetical protein